MPSHMSSAQRSPQPKKKRRGRVRVGAIVAIVIVAVLLVAYGAGVAVFGTTLFMPGTTLDGQDVSLRSVSDVASEKDASLDGLQTHVTGNGLDLTVSSSDIDLTCDGQSYASSALSQVNPWLWPYELTQERELTVETSTSYDRDKLLALIEPVIERSLEAASELGSTGVSYDAEQGLFVLDESVLALHLDADLVADSVVAGLEQGADTVQIGDECLADATSLSDAVDQANAYLAATVSLTLAGTHVADVTSDMIAGWTVIGEDLSVSLDSAAVEQWCRGELSDQLDTIGTARTYTRPDGATFTVSDTNPNYSASTYGWSIDGGACAEQIMAAVQTGEASTVDIPALQSAAQVNPGGQDWGDRYIDVDLTEQHARFYDGGTLIWEAAITTGQPNLDQETPTGVWTITNRKAAAVDGEINLRGPIDPDTGEPEWSSYVDFWLGVVGNLVGFHNAPWQSVFGGNIYTYSGSHGCIRMSYADAQALYNVAQVGDVVVIHK